MHGGVGSVVGGCFRRGRAVNPAPVLPELGDVIVVPRELLSQRSVAVDSMWRIVIVRLRVVVLSLSASRSRNHFAPTEEDRKPLTPRAQ